MPVAKYALSGSRLKFSNGRTATLFSETGGATVLTDLVDGRCGSIRIVPASATAITTTAPIVTHLSPDGFALGPETAAPIFFFPRNRLNFSGASGLPSSSVQRLTM